MKTLVSGNYELSFTGGQLIIKNKQTGTTEVLKSAIDVSVTEAKWTGKNLLFLDAKGSPITYYFEKCTDADCSLVLTNTGLLKVTSIKKGIVEQSNAYISDSKDIPGESYATVVNGEFTFSDTISDRKAFSIGNPDNITTCSLTSLQTNCNDTKNCIGFVHSSKENTWQQILTTDSNADYKISDTNTQVYLRNKTASLTGDFCPTNPTVVLMNRPLLSSYPQGKAAISNSAACTKKNPLIVPAFNNYIKGIENSLKTPVEPSIGVDRLKGIPEKIQPLLHKYETNFSSWLSTQGKPSALTTTLQQRTTDTYTLDQHYKSMAILWGVIALAMIAIIIFRPKN